MENSRGSNKLSWGVGKKSLEREYIYGGGVTYLPKIYGLSKKTIWIFLEFSV